MLNQSSKVIWNQYDIKKDELNFWKIGDLKLWCKCTTNEIQIAYKYFT